MNFDSVKEMDTNENRISLLGEVDKFPNPMAFKTEPQPHERALKKRNIFVDALAILFGISSWIGVTSTFIQLPLIYSTAPEQWSIGSYIAITVQSANIFSFAYVLYQKYSKKKIDDGYLIYLTLFIGCIAAICMAFFYQHTIEINGSRHSVALLVFSLMFALVGCLSSVLFMPYMGRFRECYLVSYMLGMGLNGFLSSIMGLIQGIGEYECIPNDSANGTGPEFIKHFVPPLFGTELYFLIVFAIMVLSTIAFVLLNNLSICKEEYAAGTVSEGNDYHYDKREKNGDDDDQPIPDEVRHLSMFNYLFLMLAVVGLSGLGNGVFPGLMSYSCLPYGDATYHFAVKLAAIANPMAGFIAMFVPHTSIRVIRVLSIIGSILAAEIFWIALQSPNPILQGTIFGTIQIVAAWTIFTCTISYMKISIVSIFRYQEGRSLVWVGTVNQISAALGSIISFILINFTNIFVEAPGKC